MDGVDKLGSDLFSLEYVLNRLEANTYDFIGETVKYIENNQEIRDDIRPLIKPLNETLNALVAGEYVATLPSDYLHLASVRVVDDNVTVRDTRVLRHGQVEIYESNPNKKSAPEYPIVLMYENFIKVLSPGSPSSVVGFYVRKPNFYVYNEDDDFDTEIAIDLPDNVVDKIIKDIINDIFVATADPRANVQYQTKEQYRKRGNR